MGTGGAGVGTRDGSRRDMLTTEPPVVSLAALREGDIATLKTLRSALRDGPGYFTLDAEVAIPSPLVTECYDRARSFFALPLDVKTCYVHTQYERETGG